MSGSGSIASTSTLATTATISGATTITLSGKQSAPGLCTSAATCMQTVTSASCGTTLTDSRDGNTYTTATINGLCWMTKNLDLPGGTALTSADTNLDESLTSYTLPASSTSGFDAYVAYVYNSGSTACGTSPCYSYYTYIAATAGTNPSSGNAASDICPKGWRLPTQTEYNALISSAGTLTSAPFRGVLAGYYNISEFGTGGGSGHAFYWSSTASNRTSASRLAFDVRSNANTYSEIKYYGFGIRCVAKS